MFGGNSLQIRNDLKSFDLKEKKWKNEGCNLNVMRKFISTRLRKALSYKIRKLGNSSNAEIEKHNININPRFAFSMHSF